MRKWLSWGLALAAISFVLWQVPVRDRCWDARAARSTHVAVSRDDQGCVLHLATGEVRVSVEQCAALKCEPGVVSTLSGARPGVLAVLFALYVAATLVWAGRWQALLGFAGVDLHVLHVWRIVTEAQAGGVLLPGGLGGDALRVASIVSLPARPGETRAPTSIVVASVLLDRAVGLSLIATVAASMGFFWGRSEAGGLVYALAAIPVGVLAGLVFLREVPIDRMRFLGEGRLGRALAPVFAYVRHPRAPRAIAYSAMLSLIVAVVQFVIIRGLVYGLGATPAAEKWVYVGAAMAFIVSALPTLPGGWGTADATYIFFFGMGGLTAGTALGVCLLFRLFWYLLAMGGAVLYVARSRAGAPGPMANAPPASPASSPSDP
ncbi:MAG: lysylphosphatidylglycerol synthase transmembrane domain-containing protein [Polyangiaceae bacterium]